MDVEEANYQYSLAAARARYPFLPTDEFMSKLGYRHQWLGRYDRVRNGQRQVVSVFSKSGSFMLQVDTDVVTYKVIASKEELLDFLTTNGFA